MPNVLHRRMLSRSLLTSATLLVVIAPRAHASHAPGARTLAQDTARVTHLLARATFGVRPGDIDALLAMGRDVWLEAQLDPRGRPDTALEARLSRLEAIAVPPGELLRRAANAAASARAATPSMAGDAAATAQPRARMTVVPAPRVILEELVTARLVRAVHAERQLEEVMTDFWFNHFNVFFGKGIDRYLVADYERSAIRPHVFGRFEGMLRATAKHPAMLFYLDNWTSVAPDTGSAARARTLTPRQRKRLMRGGRPVREPLARLDSAQTRRRARGLNENYARELLELHTLGVDAGFTQHDVTEVARAFTGWTFRRPTARTAARTGDAEVGFLFIPANHDRGEKTVLGRTLAAGRGIEDGEDVIRMLAAHPATARFIAAKLVERFVTDEPDADFVEELAEVYLRTAGDLREVTRALFTSERFYEVRWRGAKVKTPFELVASALRAVHAEVGPSRQLARTLNAMGHLPYTAAEPTGFPARSDDWVNSGALLARMNFALDLAGGRIDGVRIDPLTRRERGIRALGLALGSPEFQRR